MMNTQTRIFRATMLASAGLAGMAAPVLSKPAQAQVLQPVVDVCAGISLEDSLLRDILSTTVVPTAAGLETLYDNLLDIELNVGIGTIDLLDIPDVDLGVAQTTAALAAGDPVSLQVLDTDGNIISPGDCNVTADGYTLNDAGGIAIGGNQISGLGSGQAASAGELDAIAFGNGASTAAGANGAIAFGTDASATAANSVALGAGSLADRGPQTGYSAAFLSGTFDSAGSVSVGAAGALRQITNLAPGSDANDAATVGQVQAAIDSVNGAVANAVLYTDATQTAVALEGAGGTTISNLADGTVSAASSEAVNGSQLFATNQQVTANAGDITTLQIDVSANAADITVNANDIAQLQDTAVLYDDATQASVTLGGAGGTTIANVADGTLSAASDEAVNGSQLFATNQQVTANTGDIGTLQSDVSANAADITVLQGDVAAQGTVITNLQVEVGDNSADIAVNAGDIAQLQDTAVQYDDATQTSVTLGGAGGTTVTNLAAGTVSAGSSDAVNGAQLFATNTQVDANSVAIQANANAILAVGSTGDPLGVAYDDITRTSVTFDGAGGTLLANVQDGEVSATSSQAVNGSQLFTTNQAVTDLDGRVTTNEGDISNLDARVAVNNTAISTNTTDIANLDNRVTTNQTDIVNLDSRTTVNETNIADNSTNIGNLDNRVTTNEGNIVNLDSHVTVNTSNIASNSANMVNLDGRVTVNEGDIAGNSTAIANLDGRVTVNTTAITEVEEQLANVPIGYVADNDPSVRSDTPTNTAALLGAGGDSVRVTNVAAGNVAAGSGDAINGSQLAATNTAVAVNRTDIDRNTSEIAAMNTKIAGSMMVTVQYSDPSDPTSSNGGTMTQDVTFMGADASQPVRVHNVADGTLGTDAVNVRQVQAGMTEMMPRSTAYTDERFDLLSNGLNQLSFDLDEVRDEAFSGTASAMALAGIPQTMDPGRAMVGGAIGHYRGRTAFAIGVSTTFNDGGGVITAGGTMDSDGHGGFSAGAGFSF